MKNLFKPLILCTILFLTNCTGSRAVLADQEKQLGTEQQAVVNTLQKMFDLMHQNDVEGSKELLLKDGQYHIIDEHTGEARSVLFKKYLSDLEKGGEIVLEIMWGPTVLVDGNIATLMTKYEFFVDEELHHCGSEIFNFIKIKGMWKISGSVFTVRTAGCEKRNEK